MSQVFEKVRLDKWLWAARFFKTRSLAATEVEKNRVKLNGQYAKPAKEVKIGDLVIIQRGTGINALETAVMVQALSNIRGPASVAQKLYIETTESIKKKEEHQEKKRFLQEPAQSIQQGRPTKRDRRKISDWNRWSASIDDISDED